MDTVFRTVEMILSLFALTVFTPACSCTEGRWESCCLEHDGDEKEILYTTDAVDTLYFGLRGCGAKVAIVHEECCNAHGTLKFDADVEYVQITGVPHVSSTNENCRGLYWWCPRNEIVDNRQMEMLLEQFPNLEELELVLPNYKGDTFNLNVISGLRKMRRLVIVGERILFDNVEALNELPDMKFLRIGHEYLSPSLDDSSLSDMAIVQTFQGVRLPCLEELNLRGCLLFQYETLVNFQNLKRLHTPIFFNSRFLPIGLVEIDMSASSTPIFSETIEELTEGMRRFSSLEKIALGEFSSVKLPSDWLENQNESSGPITILERRKMACSDVR